MTEHADLTEIEIEQQEEDQLNAERSEDVIFDDYVDAQEEVVDVSEYDLISNPNDFNVLTIVNLIDQGSVVIPRFQRNFVWDKRKSSKLIESLLLNLPVPQVFLYEQSRNKFLVIDGQQRLMSIYFFVKGFFPKRNARSLPREFWGQVGGVPSAVLENPESFERFNLQLAKTPSGAPNQFARQNYDSLGDRQQQLQLRTIRVVIIKQARPEGQAAVYEIFNRLNTGGINLNAQEIRMSLNDSDFLDLLVDLNADPKWLEFLGIPGPDLRMKDIELLLRGVAMWRDIDSYSSMSRFLSEFSQKGIQFSGIELDEIRAYFSWFVDWALAVGRESFFTQTNKISAPVFEAFFAGLAPRWLAGSPELTKQSVSAIRMDPNFLTATTEQTGDKRNVLARIELVRDWT